MRNINGGKSDYERISQPYFVQGRSATGPPVAAATSSSRVLQEMRRLNARRFVSEHDVGRLAAGWTIEVMHGIVPLSDRAVFRQAVLPAGAHVVGAAA